MHLLKAIYWRARIVHLAARWMFIHNIGDRVIYQGRKWSLIQGVQAPTWSLIRGDFNGDDFERVDAHERDFRKVRTLANYIGSFRSGYRFYMRSWYSIWMNEGIQPWMLSCHIWGRRR
jgi:hypothetical protein